MPDDLCQCPTCGRMHKSLGAGKPPEAIGGPSLLRAPETTPRPRDSLRSLQAKISTRLNNHLCEMSEGMDDSIVGFNEAWDIVNAAFEEVMGEP